MTNEKKPLTDHDEYYRRYGEHLAELGNGKDAWKATERDLLTESNGCYRRYMSYESFMVALSRHKRGYRPMVVTFRCVELFFKKI